VTESLDYGWAGWQPSPDKFCLEVLPQLEAMGVNVSGEVRNDCDPGDKQYITNATQLQCEVPHHSWRKIKCSLKSCSVETSAYVGQICAMKNCSAFVRHRLPVRL